MEYIELFNNLNKVIKLSIVLVCFLVYKCSLKSKKIISNKLFKKWKNHM